MNIQDISLEWKNENEHIKNMSIPISLSQFGLDRLQRSISFEFKVLTFMTQTQHHLNKLYQNPQQFILNRNPHIMTFEPTKPILNTQEDKLKIQNYINANIIKLGDKTAIATQGPLTSTFYNVYRMIEKYNIKAIFMLCCLIEKGKKKCDRYWPNFQTEGGKMVEKEYEITLITEVKQPSELKTRKIHIKNTINNWETQITHYHFLTWPDGGRPLPQSKKTIDFLLNQFLKHAQKGEPPLVHCSAGVGRTGTFIAMGLFKKLLHEQNEISIFEAVRQLRQQRWGMVYTYAQYEYLYDFVDSEIQSILNQGNGPLSSESDQEDQIKISIESQEHTSD